MAVNIEAYNKILTELNSKATLVAVSKTKPVTDLQEFYDSGQRDFGENYVQELVDKELLLPKAIRWHFIGHLQSNKVKYIAPFVYLIHGVDSFNLLKEINKEAAKNNRVIDCLLQVHIAKEETKFGLDATELSEVMKESATLKNVHIAGLMGMASFSDDRTLVRKEFTELRSLYNQYSGFSILSMGMSGDYTIAMEEGSNMIRIGSLLFGERLYPAK
ncbi:YggS family pyridoxal phosphate-dependent enzyme [Ferruginibacter sp.]|uniref:YggS family pyridoxal phosphate-dependent enzyme n=1 Tax=Ferruginibacter sp. TaxID=1940288 RepID=UPI0019CED553|nr:YggS family pyridoxal phosphate-dependent enzyme [Ferruginibacter sp.]MBC7629076.1 YggS family pyridoxal phosphate-dependent enzyme [Ferruginibacter sp.]